VRLFSSQSCATAPERERTTFSMLRRHTLASLTPGIEDLSITVGPHSNGEITFGRDHEMSSCRTGITSMQVSRQQGQLRVEENGTLVLRNRGIGLMRVLMPIDIEERIQPMRASEKRVLSQGDRLQILTVLRTCSCSLQQRCTCTGGNGDQLAVHAEWRVALAPARAAPKVEPPATYASAPTLASHEEDALRKHKESTQPPGSAGSAGSASSASSGGAVDPPNAALASPSPMAVATPLPQPNAAAPQHKSLASAAEAMGELRRALQSHSMPRTTSDKLRTLEASVEAAITAARAHTEEPDAAGSASAAKPASGLAEQQPSDEAVPLAGSSSSESPPWDADDPLEAIRRAASEARADEGWVQCEPARTWTLGRPPARV
jgi:hypothetical protein